MKKTKIVLMNILIIVVIISSIITGNASALLGWISSLILLWLYILSNKDAFE